MKCYKVEITYYIHAEDEDDAEMVVQDIGVTDSEYYSCHYITEEDKTETNLDMDCYDCKKWEKGREDGTCIHYINNDCPYGYHDSDENNISE